MSNPDLPSTNDPVNSKSKPSEPSLLSGLDPIHPKSGLLNPKFPSKIGLTYHGSMGHHLSPLIGIFIEAPDGLLYEIEINQHATIIELKQKAHESTGAPLDRIRFTYAGKDVGSLFGGEERRGQTQRLRYSPKLCLASEVKQSRRWPIKVGTGFENEELSSSK